MKKYLTALAICLTTATANAATNPFSDVPAGHWAYNAVTRLAAEGVIEGYGDGTFLGNRNITRYEMAQMLAKALAKQPQVTGASRADLDRLAAEFRAELDSLGVRVAELEKHSDMVQFSGIVRADFVRDRAYPWAWLINNNSIHDFTREDTHENSILARFEVDGAVSDKWHALARLEGYVNLTDDDTTDLSLKRIYAQGQLGNATILRLGKFGLLDSENLTNAGFIIDSDYLSGASLEFGNNIKLKLTAGRFNHNYLNLSHGAESNSAMEYIRNKWDNADYQSAELFGNAGKWSWSLGYHRLTTDMMIKSFGTEKEIIGALGVDYHFDNNWTLGLYHSHGTLPVPGDDVFSDDMEKEGYSAQITYKQANPTDAGSFGTWLAYRHLGCYSAIAPTFDGAQLGAKGLEYGLEFVPMQNLKVSFVGFWGRHIGSGDITQTARVAERWLGGHATERYTTHFLGRIEYSF